MKIAPILLCVLGTSLLAGCGARISVPTPEQVPGVYEGKIGNLRETVEFRDDGFYQHQLFDGQKEVLSEAGKWAISASSGALDLTPETKFSHVYDSTTKQLTTNALACINYVFLPLKTDRVLLKIAAVAVPNEEYQLTRK